MKKIILILTMLFASLTYAQDKFMDWGGLMANIHGNLFDVNRLSFLTSDNLTLSVISGRTELTQTGAVVQNILDGTMDFSVDITGTSTNQIKVPISNDAVTPTIAFGDGNTGFYEISDNQLGITLGGSLRWVLTTAEYYANIGSGPSMRFSTPTATNPSFVFHLDLDTGLGHAGADTLSLIAGGVEAIRISEATHIEIDLKGSVTFGLGTITSTADNVDVAGVSVLNVDSAGGSVTIGGFVNGIANQVLHIYNSGTNDIIIEDDEATGNQDIKTNTGSDVTVTVEGGVTLIYDGTDSIWRMIGAAL